jgi:hypothetical protein
MSIFMEVMYHGRFRTLGEASNGGRRDAAAAFTAV